jgi:hypothetical protein
MSVSKLNKDLIENNNNSIENLEDKTYQKLHGRLKQRNI